MENQPKKLRLDEVKVESFVTSDYLNIGTVKGGTYFNSGCCGGGSIPFIDGGCGTGGSGGNSGYPLADCGGPPVGSINGWIRELCIPPNPPGWSIYLPSCAPIFCEEDPISAITGTNGQPNVCCA